MANSAVVGTLRAILSADTAEFASAMKKASDTAEKAATDISKTGAAFSALEPRMAAVTRLVKDFSGSLERRSAEEFALAIEKIGGAAKLSESELKRAGNVFNDYISKAKAMGQEVPQHIQKVSDEISKLSATSSKSTGIIGDIRGAFANLGPSVLAAAGGFATALISVEALTQGLRASVQFVKDSIQQYLEAEKAQRKLVAALEAQRSATPETIRAYKELADQFQRTTVFSDDLIMEMQTLLVQVGNVMPNEMEGALTAVTNLASGLGIDLRSATMMVARAAEDNFTALKKQGVQIDETALKAQGFAHVLEAVNAKFGGQAQADLQTFSGQLQQTQNQFLELQESIGKVIVESTAFQLAFIVLRAELAQLTHEINFFIAASKALASMPGAVGSAFQLLVGDLNDTEASLNSVNSAIANYNRMKWGVNPQLPKEWRNYADELKNVKDRLDELTPAQLEQIDAAKKLGVPLDDLAKIYGFTTKELGLLSKETKENKKVVNESEKAYREWAEEVTGAKLLKSLAELDTRLGRLTKEGGLNSKAMKAIAEEASKLAQAGAVLTPRLQTLVNEFIGLKAGVVSTTVALPAFSDALSVSGEELRELGKDFQDINKKFDDLNKLINTSKGVQDLFKGGVSAKELDEARQKILSFSDKAANAMFTLGGAFQDVGHIIGGQAGHIVSSVGSIADGIGLLASGATLAGVTALAGAVVGLAKHFKTLGRNVARDMQDAFATTELGFANLNTLMQRLRDLGAMDLVSAGDRAQRKDDEKATRQWMEDVREFLDEIDRRAALAFGQLSEAAADFGGKAPAALQPFIQQLLLANTLTAEQRDLLTGLAGAPEWEQLQSIAQKYGIELAALGQNFQQARIGDMALQYARDFMTLRDAGGDVNGLLIGMQDEVQALVNDALKFGTAVPEALRPVLEGLMQMGLLTDENGNKLDDLSRFSFTGTLEDAFKDMKSILEEIRDLLAGGLPNAARTGGQEVERSFSGVFDRLRRQVEDTRFTIPIEFEAGAFTPPSGFEAPSAQEGGRVVKPGLVNVHAGEVIGPLNELDLGQDARIDNRLYIDGREVTVSVVQHMREVARRLGVRPI